MSQMQNTTITSPCLDSLVEHVKNNISRYTKAERGSFANDDVISEEVWNVPGNYSVLPINDEYTYEFETVLQNSTSGVVKLLTYYADGDFIGWHTNSAATGYNLILTYSETESSYFETVEGKVYDILGWSYKLNTFDDTLFWHRAVAKGPRVTLSLLFDTEIDRSEAITTIQKLVLE